MREQVTRVLCLSTPRGARRAGGAGQEAEEAGSVLASPAGSAFRLHGGNCIPGAG